MEKNEEFVGIVEALGANGEGIIIKDGYVVFVPNALIGEKVRYKILKVAKNYAFGKTEEIFSPAEERVRPKCPAFGKCGGCQMQHLIYREQLKNKIKTVKDCFYKTAHIDVTPNGISQSDKIYGYRNKLQIPVAKTVQGTKIGFFAANSHRLIPVDDCPINEEWAKDIIEIFKDYIERNNIQGYSDITKDGVLKHIVVREQDGKFAITAVATERELPDINYLTERLKQKFKAFSLFLNINKQDTNVIFGREFICLYGESRLSALYNGLKFEFGPESFLQINDNVCRKLYDKVTELSALGEDRVVIDAYSGAGIMTALLARKAKKAIGIECVKEAVECADRLKELNKLEDKMENILGECEKVLPRLIDELKADGEKISLVLDPPRKGCDIAVISAVLHSGIEKLIYVSCNPATLARDVGLLTGTLKVCENGEIKKNEEYFAELCDCDITEKGQLSFNNGKEELSERQKSCSEFAHSKGYYSIEYLQCFDMFPQTKHVETLVVLKR